MNMIAVSALWRCRVLSFLAVLVCVGQANVVWGQSVSDLVAGDDRPERVVLVDGSVIYGQVTDVNAGVVVLKTSFNDALEIDTSLIKNLWSAQSAELLLDDDRVISLESIEVRDGELTLSEQESVALADLDVLNPEAWETGNGYHWLGSTSAALAANRGNTETNEIDIAFDTTMESLRDRYTLRGKIEQDESWVQTGTDADGNATGEWRDTADNWRVTTKYDYFLSDPDNYIGANLNVEADSLANINLRTYVGPYIGRKLFRRDNLKLDGEIGLMYVDTDFDIEVDGESEDYAYTGFNWNLTGESNILGGESRIYLTHVGIIDVEDAQQLILNTTLGLAFPLVFGLEGAAEITLDYDGGAADGAENLDQVYKFRVGYSW
ncbi:conserved hypothetical protein [Luminiphilus syltensis NOR5-1B]|uniref:DUF481 domain-containing protein n=1 Tax=Luminiphilus syltensis NOR5-1B TaxID=565045 RepID=B8KTN5_9GAMM|nr:DUF481 domain-containing protein [Luminiphilus syltensis]EED35403.1 conserved hypothetical protein [Luminiphilus syltensis NOR5-1B]